MGGRCRVEAEVQVVLSELTRQLRKYLAYPEHATDWFVHHGQVTGGQAARASWRVLFADTLLQWDKQQQGK
jgi:hypothetical protein